jgi:hypothetical protein
VTFSLTPNPARGILRLVFSLSAPTTVGLDVFDIAGRRVLTPLARSLQRAGEHTLSLDTLRLPAGVYYCRLDVGGVETTRRFVVLE